MFTRSVCQAVLLLVAVTAVAGQYLRVYTFTDNNCATQVPGYLVIYNPAADGCKAGTSTTCVAGIDNTYTITNCSTTDPVASITNMFMIQAYASADASCTAPYSSTVVSAKAGDCVSSLGTWVKLGGCETQGANVTLAAFDSEADCKSGSNPTQSASVYSDRCTPAGTADYNGKCPAANSAPVAGTTPTASSPVAATPGKKSAAASTTVVGLVSAVALFVMA